MKQLGGDAKKLAAGAMAVVMVAVLSISYGVVQNTWLGTKAHRQPQGNGSDAVQSLQITAQADVSNATVAKIADSIAAVAGADELVVMPSIVGSGYVVSTDIALSGFNLTTGTWTDIVKRDVPTYFADVYNTGLPIENAEVYFLLNGQLVAGAALGADSYRNIGVVASSGSNALLRELTQGPQITADGPNDHWFELQTGVR